MLSRFPEATSVGQLKEVELSPAQLWGERKGVRRQIATRGEDFRSQGRWLGQPTELEAGKAVCHGSQSTREAHPFWTARMTAYNLGCCAYNPFLKMVLECSEDLDIDIDIRIDSGTSGDLMEKGLLATALIGLLAGNGLVAQGMPNQMGFGVHAGLAFPAGDDLRMTAKTGVARIALTTGAPVIPAAQWGPQEVLMPYSKVPKFFPRKTMHVWAGEPVDLDDLRTLPITVATLREATERIMGEITKILAEQRQELPPAQPLDRREALKKKEDS